MGRPVLRKERQRNSLLRITIYMDICPTDIADQMDVYAIMTNERLNQAKRVQDLLV